MKKQIFVCLGLALIAFGCKKDKNTEELVDQVPGIGGTATGIPPAYVTPVAGALKVNVSSLMLHPGTTANLIVQLYDAQGMISSSLPALTWETSNADIAEINNGIVSANDPGHCEITLSDGIHGKLSVNVIVVPSTSPLSTKPAYIAWPFTGDVLVMKPKTLQTLTNYTVYNQQGQAVNSPITLWQSDTALVCMGKQVTSRSTPGSYNVKVLAGTDTLLNNLRVAVINTDTLYDIDIVHGSLAASFLKSPVSSEREVRLRVTQVWYVGTTLTYSTFITSPTKIVFTGNEISLNSAGYLTSSKPTRYLFGNLTKFYYKNHYTIRYLSVCVNITGTWGFSPDAKNQYNYCITQHGPDIIYGPGITAAGDTNAVFWFDPNFGIELSGTYNIVKDGEPFMYGATNEIHGTYRPTDLTFIGSGHVQLFHDGQSTSSPARLSFRNENAFVATLDGHHGDFDRGTGNCVMIPEDVDLQGTMHLKSRTLKIGMRDISEIDGDIVTVIVDGNPVLSNYTLTGDNKYINITLQGDISWIAVKAISEGSSSPCTPGFSVDDGTSVQEFELDSYTDGKSGGYLLMVRK